MSLRRGIVRLGLDRQHNMESVVKGASDTGGAFSRVLLFHAPLLLAPDSCICRDGCDRHIHLATTACIQRIEAEQGADGQSLKLSGASDRRGFAFDSVEPPRN